MLHKSFVMQISAKKGTGVDDLLETVALVAEVEQLMANPDKAAAGTVLEAHLDKRVGAIATLLVQTGTLRVGDVVVAGAAYGKVGHCVHGVTSLGGASRGCCLRWSSIWQGGSLCSWCFVTWWCEAIHLSRHVYCLLPCLHVATKF